MKFLFLFCLATTALAQPGKVDRYRVVHDSAIVVDTHNDVVQRILAGEDLSYRTTHGHSDIPRWREGGVDIQVFSIWVPPEVTHPSYYDQANEQIDSVESLIRRNSGVAALAGTAADAEKNVRQGKFVAMLGIEGGHAIESDIHKLEHFYRRGVRYMTLTWNNSTPWATSAKDETAKPNTLKHKGLTALGKNIVHRMNQLGMMVDVSHVGEQTFWDVLKTSTKPVIASHSSSWALTHHRRNLKDEQLKALAKQGGVVFVNFNPGFIDSSFPAREEALKKKYAARIDSFTATRRWRTSFDRDNAVTEYLAQEYRTIRPPLKLLIDHIDYVCKLIGTDHVGIGSDFDGINTTPLDMDDVTFLPNVTRELMNRGYTESDLKKILGGNFLRVLKANEKK